MIRLKSVNNVQYLNLPSIVFTVYKDGHGIPPDLGFWTKQLARVDSSSDHIDVEEIQHDNVSERPECSAAPQKISQRNLNDLVWDLSLSKS